MDCCQPMLLSASWMLARFQPGRLRKLFPWTLVAMTMFLGIQTDASDIDALYFIRNTRYVMMKERLVLVERDRAGMVTVDEWPQLVYLSADGEHTVGEFISVLGKQYASGMPQGFEAQTRQVIRDLASRGYIALLPTKKQLPYYLSMPVEQQDKEKAKTLTEADGFIKKNGK